MRKFFQTARFRIALWNTFGVAGIALAALFAVRQGIWWTMLQETDGLLLEDVREIELALKELPRDNFIQLTDELRRKAMGHKAHDWFVILLDEKGDVLWQSNDMMSVELPDLKSVTTRGRYTRDSCA
jgi:hypothetical protein